VKLHDLHARLLAGRLPLASVDALGINDTIRRALDAAGLDTRSTTLQGVHATIQRALCAAGLATPERTSAPDSRATTIEGVARRIDATPDGPAGTRAEPSRTRAAPGDFVSRSFTNAAGTRRYKLYVPARHASEPMQPMPLIVMLHGCTQSPVDFAAGTRMNALAEQHGFVVVYPAQPADANGAKCWNWFRASDQRRDAGEPSLIAGITHEVAASCGIDERRIFVAGLSAGGAMAVILGATYPELFAAVGVHSGLPLGAAHDLPSALHAMRGGSGRAEARRFESAGSLPLPPTIVFHGDNDATVDACNGAAIAQHAAGSRPDAERLRADVREGVAAGGRAYRRIVHTDAGGHGVVEQWVLHGAGHAWSGGSGRASFTDPSGPDASAEMIRFFLSQRRAGTA
jgi:poly(hydroxyalkanoate) depolymerase family esterase